MFLRYHYFSYRTVAQRHDIYPLRQREAGLAFAQSLFPQQRADDRINMHGHRTTCRQTKQFSLCPERYFRFDDDIGYRLRQRHLIRHRQLGICGVRDGTRQRFAHIRFGKRKESVSISLRNHGSAPVRSNKHGCRFVQFILAPQIDFVGWCRQRHFGLRCIRTQERRPG